VYFIIQQVQIQQQAKLLNPVKKIKTDTGKQE
jgi:hypothetical protein